LEETNAQFPDDVREALTSALKLVDRIEADLGYGDEPSHVFQAARSLEAEAKDGGS
jgi:hypothetical protein